ncbi:M23 family metallopeptidase [Sphingomonas endolithica]|uniref:M23 family metallopeptidase n=1 Tax=Sphingomonas endolithica TaxID=2972485 RepID=UPI0021AF7584|nr:M23 family metallopeptidase [Sphingomonas sp. ZFBP2030]
MFLYGDQGNDQAGGTATISFGRAPVVLPTPTGAERLRARIDRIDWAPDLGSRIGSSEWWRGAATCTALIAATCLLSPGFHRPITGSVAPAYSGSEWDEARAQSIAPLAWGAGTGRHMGANDLARPLAQTPERPMIELSVMFGQGDSFVRALQRAGVSATDSSRAAGLIAGAIDLNAIRPGTRIDMTLGRRANRNVARPLDQLAFRARFDLNLSLARSGDALAMARHPIAIDTTPLRIQGMAGSSLYRSARAAGVPAKAVEAYIKAVASRVSVGAVGAGDTFDIIIEQARAATGEVQLGTLMFAGLDQGRRNTQLVRWDDGQWFDAKGQTERQGFMGMPVSGRITSGFGLRMHPLLHYMRMHKGIDFGAPWGSPIYAAVDGVVKVAGRSAGYGNLVKLDHGNGISSGYGHMSRILVRPGQHVSRGQQIGAVGSTGMSTGPHLHWEVWKNGVAVNPRSFSFASVAVLSGEKLRAFKARVAALMAVRPGGR